HGGCPPGPSLSGVEGGGGHPSTAEPATPTGRPGRSPEGPRGVAARRGRARRGHPRPPRGRAEALRRGPLMEFRVWIRGGVEAELDRHLTSDGASKALAFLHRYLRDGALPARSEERDAL